MRSFALLPLLFSIAAGATLVENGVPRGTVTASAEDGEAARELIAYVERVTGARLPSAAGGKAGAAQVLVGLGACPPEVRRELATLGTDAYVVQSRPDGTLVLAGNGPDGTFFAVDAFLEQYAGVRWLWPGELGEVIPRRPTLRVPETTQRHVPAYVWRDLGPGGALWGSLDKWAAERRLGVSEAHQSAQKLWERRNRFGGVKIYGGHAFGEMLPPERYGPTHPEYYALVGGRRDWQHFDGKHGCQPCTTHPDVIKIVTDYAGQFFVTHPDYEAFAISLNDGGGFCECERCRALDSGQTEVAAGDPEGGKGGKKAVISDRIVTFANTVAAAVTRTHPGKKLILFAYGQYKQPPTRVKTADNVIIQYTFHVANNWSPQSEAQQFNETRAWAGAASHLGIYEYFIQGNFPDLPRPMLQPLQRSVQELHRQGYRYYQTQSGDGYAINGLTYYLLGRLLWDPAADLASLRADYFAAGFGPAADTVQRAYGRWESAWRDLAGKSVAMDAATQAQYQRIAEAYPVALRRAVAADLREAAALVSGAERARVEFLQVGLRYIDLTLDAVEATLPLLDGGWKLDKKIVAPANPDMTAFGRARDAWEARERFVATQRDGFALAYFWVRYNEQNRTFWPLERMRAFKAPAN